MTELNPLKWQEIFSQLIEEGHYDVGSVNYYHLTSILEDLYVENQELKSRVETLEKDMELIKSQPRMEFDFGGKFEVVSYNDEVYYRLEFPDEVYWYRRKYKFADGMTLVHITDGETYRLLDGLWFNEVKRGKYD